MNKASKLLWLIAAALLIFCASCEKDEEEDLTSKPSMEGAVNYHMPRYVSAGEMVNTTVGGITKPSDPVYKWFIPTLYDDTLSTRQISIQFPDSLADYTVTCTALHSDYYSSTRSVVVTTVDAERNGSLTGLKYSDKNIIDARDGVMYNYTTIGNLDWFSQNLAWDGAGVAYLFSPITHTLFGRLYNWDEATCGESAHGLGAGPQGVCPEGWSVPTNEDWEDFAAAVGGKDYPFVNDWDGIGEKASVNAYFNEAKMWPYSPDNEHTNTVGFNALPIGNAQLDLGWFKGFEEYAFFWSSSEKGDDKAYLRYIYFDQGSFPMSSTTKSDFGASVRCVRLAR